ncbi:MAG: response regulator [Alphaproteobacteria bacterium]|nr:response regulator [Alphaproteobacteria bacterium]
MRRVSIFLCLVLCIALGGQAVHADAEPWDRVVPPVFKHLNATNGLPYPVAFSIVQDGEGYIWVATPGGLARWDGLRLTVFRHDENVEGSLPENIVTHLHTDRQGRLWLSSASGIVSRFDASRRKFISYRDNGSGVGRVLDLASDDKGGIWIAGRRGLARLDSNKGVWDYQDALKGMPPGEVTSLLIDSAGRVWAGSAEGLMRKNDAHQAFQRIVMPPRTKVGKVTALFEDSHHVIWFGTGKGAVGTVDDERGQLNFEPTLPLTGHQISSIIEVRPGVLWFGEFGNGIRELRTASFETRHFQHSPSLTASLGDNSVSGLLVDRSGMVWASTQAGVSYSIPANRQIMTIVPSQPKGLQGMDARSLAASQKGRVWVGHRRSGIALLDPIANVVKSIPTGNQPGDLPVGAVQTIVDSGDGKLWVGLPSGLYRVDQVSKQATQYMPLANTDVRALLLDKRGLWVTGSEGLALIKSENEPPKLFQPSRDNPTSISDASGMALALDRMGRIWVATQRGLNLLEDEKDGKFRRFLADPDNPNGLHSNIVSSIGSDSSGRFWLGTGDGIAIFDPTQLDEPKFMRLGVEQGLPHDTVLSVIEGADGKMFAGTGGGLAVIDPQDFSIRTIEPSQGGQIGTFWASSAARLTDGTLALGGFGGMVVIRPGPLPEWNFKPPMVLTEVRVGRKVVAASGGITIEPKNRGFSVEFAALDFSAPEKNRYAYRLLGSDQDWVSIQARQRFIRYANLSPGSYRLEVKGSNGVGNMNADPVSLEIQVMPAWHQTWWFRLLIALACLAALVGLWQGRKLYYLRRELELTLQVAAKTSEVETAMRRAVAGEEEARRAKETAESADQMKSRFLAIIGHEIRTPLNGLLGMLQLLDPRSLEKGPRELLTTAKEAGNNLRYLVESILEYGRSSVKDPEIALSDIELHRLATDTLALIRPQAQAKGLDLILKVRPEQPLWIRCDQIKLSRILINLLGNAVKFTDAGSITTNLCVREEGDHLRLSVAVIDTGIGITDDLREAIFGDFVQADDSITRKYGGAGLGLAISRRMAAQMAGTLTVESNVGMGSRFHLDIQVEPAKPHLEAEVSEVQATTPSLRVFVVDDDEINLRVARQLLLRLGHSPTCFKCGKDAIKALPGADVDAILMDLRMPAMDGMEATRRIRQWEKDRQGRLRILAMTADLSKEVWRQCEEAGMDGGVAKPVQLAKLKEALDETDLPDLPIYPRSRALDKAFLRVQLEMLGSGEMIRLARLFQKSSRLMIDAMEAAALAGDRQTVEAQAHRMRSAAGPLGLADVADKAGQVEQESPTASQEHLQTLVGELRKARRSGLEALGAAARGLGVDQEEAAGAANL